MTKISLCVILWSSLSAYGASELHKMAEQNPGGSAEAWIDHLDKANKPLSVIGSLFSFSLVFRFKVCYDRWWNGRGKWLDIITNCLDLSMQSYRWFSNRDFADHMNRYLIVYAYACKAQLRGESIKGIGGDGKALVLRGHLSMEELEDIHNYPSWQPHYCTEMMREIHQASMLQSGSFYLEPVKMHGQLYRCFDNTIKNLINLIGDCISLQSSEMPVAYDGIHLLIFFVYFTFAAVIWSVSLSWLVVPLEFAVSSVVLLFIVLGTKLVDPFGTDAVSMIEKSISYFQKACILNLYSCRLIFLFMTFATQLKLRYVQSKREQIEALSKSSQLAQFLQQRTILEIKSYTKDSHSELEN